MTMYDKVYNNLVQATGDYLAAAILSFLYQVIYNLKFAANPFARTNLIVTRA